MNPLILDTNPSYNSPIIIALDFDNEKEVLNLVSQLSPNLCKLKIGKELFTSTGPKLVEKLVVSGYKVFLDLKFHDIPNTTYKACKAAANLGVWMTNVHASGGQKMLEMAKQGIYEAGTNTLLIAVTTLTSMSQEELYQIGVKENITKHVINLAKISHNSGLDGAVCSAHEAPQIKKEIAQEFLTVCPGIRLTLDLNDDQTRIMTPELAATNQVDYMVIGRPVTKASNPYQQLIEILSRIKS